MAITSIIKSNKFIFFFFIKALMLYLIWYFTYELYLSKVGWVDELLIDNLVYLTEKVLTNMGYTMFVYEHTIGIDGSHGVYIGTPCNGLELMALFSGMILLFRGNWKKKLWYIPLGLVVIHLLNLCRVVALTFMAKFNPEALEFNHKYTFTIVLYFIVFCGWIIWIKKIQGKIK